MKTVAHVANCVAPASVQVVLNAVRFLRVKRNAMKTMLYGKDFVRIARKMLHLHALAVGLFTLAQERNVQNVLLE